MTTLEDHKVRGALPTKAQLLTIASNYLAAEGYEVVSSNVTFVRDDGWRVNAMVDTKDPEWGVVSVRVRGWYINGLPAVDELH